MKTSIIALFIPAAIVVVGGYSMMPKNKINLSVDASGISGQNQKVKVRVRAVDKNNLDKELYAVDTDAVVKNGKLKTSWKQPAKGNGALVELCVVSAGGSINADLLCQPGSGKISCPYEIGASNRVVGNKKITDDNRIGCDGQKNFNDVSVVSSLAAVRNSGLNIEGDGILVSENGVIKAVALNQFAQKVVNNNITLNQQIQSGAPAAETAQQQSPAANVNSVATSQSASTPDKFLSLALPGVAGVQGDRGLKGDRGEKGDTGIATVSGGGLVLTGANLSLADNCVNGQVLRFNGTQWLCASVAGTDAQTLSLASNTLSIVNGNSINLAYLLDNTDAQTLAWNGGTRTLNIAGGNSVVIPDADTTYSAGTGLSLSGNTFAIASTGVGAGTYNLVTVNGEGRVTNASSVGYLTNETDGVVGNEIANVAAGSGLVRTGTGTAGDPYVVSLVTACSSAQLLKWNGTAWACANDVDTNTDAQTLSIVGNTLSIAGGNSVNLSAYLDNTDNQSLSFGANTLSLTNGGSVNLSSYLDNTDNQSLSWNSGTRTLSLASGGSVVISDVDTTYSAGSGLALAGTSFAINAPTCSGTTKLQWNGTAFVCTADVDTDTDTTNFNILANGAGTQNIASGNNINFQNGTGTTATLDASKNVTYNLNNTAVTAGTYGTSTSVPVLTIDAQGRITNATTQTIAFPSEVDGIIGNEVAGATGAASGLIRSGTGTTIDPYTLAVNIGNGLSIGSNQIQISSPACSGTDKLQWNGTAFVCTADIDTNTTYSAATGISLAGTVFSNTGALSVTGSGAVVSSGGQTPNITITTSSNLTQAGNTLDLTASGVGAGTYNSVTVDVKGRVTAGSNAAYLTSEGDAVVGNEIVDVTAGSGLVRTGTGTTGDPYKVSLLTGCSNNQILKWNGSSWTCANDIDTNTDAQSISLATNTLSISGNASTVDLSPYLDNTDNQSLSWNSGTRTLSLASGGSVVISDADTTYSAGSGLALSGATFSLAQQAATSGQVLKWNGSSWVPAADTDTNTTYSAGTGITLSSTTFSLTNDFGSSIDSSEITDGTIAAVDLASSSVTSAKIADGTVLFADIAANGCSNGSIIQYNGSSWACGTPAGETALTVNDSSTIDFTASGTANHTLTAIIIDGSVTAAKLGADVVDTTKIAAGAVGTSDIANAAVDSSKLATDSVTSAKITDGTIATTDLADAAVTAIKLADGSVSTTKLAACSTNGQILKYYATDPDGAGPLVVGWNCGTDIDTNTDAVSSVFGRTGVVTAQSGDYTAAQINNVAAGNISAVTVQAALNELDNEKLAVTLGNGQIWVGNGTGTATAVTPSGDVAISNTGVTTIQANAVALGTDTTGNYVSGNTAGNGISISGTAGEGWSPTIAINAPTCSGTTKLQWNGTAFVCTTDVDTDTDTTNFNILANGAGTQNIASGNNINFQNGTGTTATLDASKNVTYNLNNTAVTAGTYSPANNANGSLAIPQFTVDAQGRLTAASTANVTLTGIANSQLANSSVTVTAGSGLANGGSVSLGGSVALNIGAGNGITVNADDIAVRVAASSDALSATTSSGSGLEVLGSGLALLQGCADTQVLKWNETTDVWACGSDIDTNSGGTVTSIAAGTGLSGGTITSTGTLAIANTGVTAGSYGSSTTVPVITVNAQGQITAASTVAIPTAATSTTGLLASADWNTFNGKENALTFTGNGLFSRSANTITGATCTLAGQILKWNGTTFACAADDTVGGAGVTDGDKGDVVVSGSGLVWNVDADAVALGTDTTGNYVSGNTAGNGISISGTAGEGWSPTIAINAPTCSGTTKLQWNGTAFVCTADVDTDTDAQTLSYSASTRALSISGGNSITFPLADGTETNAGLLSQANWNTFNAKENALTFTGNGLFSRSANTVSGITCANNQTFKSNGTSWACGSDNDTTYTAGTGLSLSSGQFSIANTAVTAGLYGSASSFQIPIINVDAQGRITTAANGTMANASASARGVLTSADWNTFNAKENALTFTGNGLFSRSADTISGLVCGTNNQILRSNGTSWACGTDVISVNALSGALTTAIGSTGTDFNISSSGSTITFNLPDASASARGVVTTSAQTFAGNKTFTGNTSISGASTFTTGTGLTTVSGAQLWTSTPVSNLVTGGSIGTAATTVDVSSMFAVNQTTAGQTLSLPSPTTATIGRIAQVQNIGTTSFVIGGITVPSNGFTSFAWNGSAWSSVAAPGITTLVAPSGSNVNGGVVSGNTLSLSFADGTNPGLVSTSAQTFGGNKTFNAGLVATCTNTTTNVLCDGGNTRGAGIVVGSNDANTLTIETNNTNRFIVDSATSTITGQGATDYSSTGATTVSSAAGSTLTLDSGTTGALNIGTGANAKAITIGNTTGATGVTLSCGTGACNMNGSVVNKTLAITNLATGGSIGAAAATVDLASSFNLTQTTANQTVTLPAPSTTTAGRVAYLNNTGTSSFYFMGTQVIPGASRQVIWNGSSWALTGNADDRSSVSVRKTADQSVTSSVAPVNDTDLKFGVGANETWIFQIAGTVKNGATANLRLRMSVASSVSCSNTAQASYNGSSVTNAACNTDLILTNINNQASTGNSDQFMYEGVFKNGAAATTAQLMWAQGTSTATATTIAKDVILTAYRVSGADYAENYFSNDLSILPGMVVELDGTGRSQVKKANNPYSDKQIGIVSTKPGQIIGEADGTGKILPIALSGRIPVKLSTENGLPKAGDMITASATKPGYGMLAKKSGSIVGQMMVNAKDNGDGTADGFVYVRHSQWQAPVTFDLSDILAVGGLTVNGQGQQLSQLGIDDQAITANTSYSGFDQAIIDQIIGGFKTQQNQIASMQDQAQKLETRVVSLEAQTLKDIVWSGGIVTKDTTFNGLVHFAQPVTFSANNIGTATIPAGATRVQVVLPSSLSAAPKVTATKQQFIGGDWRVSGQTANGFVLEIQNPQSEDIVFDWHAFATK